MYIVVQGGKPVPEAVKQGVETPGKSKGGAGKAKAAADEAASAGKAGVSNVSSKAKSNPQFEAFIRRARGGK